MHFFACYRNWRETDSGVVDSATDVPVFVNPRQIVSVQQTGKYWSEIKTVLGDVLYAPMTAGVVLNILKRS